MKTSGKLLFYTGDIDFQHLDTYFQNDGFEVVYSDKKSEFEELCLGTKFELIIYSAYNESLIGNSILRGLTGTKNLYSPVLILQARMTVS